MRRYTKDKRIRGGKLETAKTVTALRRARDFGLVSTKEIILKESQRLDHLAHEHLGNSRFWWILAALSDIGWGLQLPPGTVVRIPVDMKVIQTIIG